MTFLKLGGKERPFQITFRVIALMQKECGLSFADMANMNAVHMESLLFHGLQSGFRAQNEGIWPKWERKDLEDWLDTPDGFAALRQAQEEMQQMANVINGDEETAPAGNPAGGAAPN